MAVDYCARRGWILESCVLANKEVAHEVVLSPPTDSTWYGSLACDAKAASSYGGAVIGHAS